jgi:hypothetical protein
MEQYDRELAAVVKGREGGHITKEEYVERLLNLVVMLVFWGLRQVPPTEGSIGAWHADHQVVANTTVQGRGPSEALDLDHLRSEPLHDRRLDDRTGVVSWRHEFGGYRGQRPKEYGDET